MSLRERIFSLETEYGVQFYADEGCAAPSPEHYVRVLVSTVSEAHGLPHSIYLANGSKFHYDVGHPEWSLPECRSPREAASYDKAADSVLRESTPAALDALRRQGHRGHLLLFKNNVDSAGHTFGCHENYMMRRDTALLGGTPFLRYMIRCLVPFLITRQLLCGGGSLRFTDEGRPVFGLSQRADFISAVASKETTSDRAIVNLGREGEPLSPGGYRRLHLIIGDSNISGWATWMKLGTTGLLLRMIEDLYLDDVPLVADPVGAVREISNDLSCSRAVPLRDGGRMTALEIQWYYYETACDYVAQFGASDEEQDVLDEWEQALDDLQKDPMRLRDRADWAIKRRILDANLARRGGAWEGWEADAESRSALAALNIRFHDLSSQGLFSQLYPEDVLVSADEIRRARAEPPPYTRANVRGRVITLARKDRRPVRVETWSGLYVGDTFVSLRDPLQFAHRWVEGTYAEPEMLRALQHEDAEVRVRAAGYLGWSRGEHVLRALTSAAGGDPHERVRRAALKAIGEMQTDGGVPVLIDFLQSGDTHLRWAAEAALNSTAPYAEDDGEGDGDEEEPLVNLLR